MGRYFIRRLLQMIPVLIGSTFLIFAATWALPGDPFAGKCGQRACPPAYVQAQTERLNLDDGLFVQYFKFMKNLLTGNLGETFAGDSITTLVATAFPVTLRLAVLAIIFELVIGISAGILSGLRRGGRDTRRSQIGGARHARVSALARNRSRRTDLSGRSLITRYAAASKFSNRIFRHNPK